MVFTIEGEGEFDSQQIPKTVRDMIQVLDTLEDGKLLKRLAIASRISRSDQTVLQNSTHPALKDYKFIHGRTAYYGSKATIAAARNQFKV